MHLTKESAEMRCVLLSVNKTPVSERVLTKGKGEGEQPLSTSAKILRCACFYFPFAICHLSVVIAWLGGALQ